MYIVTKTEWRVGDGANKGQTVTIPPGRHEVERIPNPVGFDAPWLVLKGTQIGACEGFWRDWSDPEYKEFQVIVEEE